MSSVEEELALLRQQNEMLQQHNRELREQSSSPKRRQLNPEDDSPAKSAKRSSKKQQSAIKKQLEDQRNLFETEILALQDQVGSLRAIQDPRIARDMEKIKIENEFLRQTLENIHVAGSSGEEYGYEDEEEQLRKWHYYQAMQAAQAREGGRSGTGPRGRSSAGKKSVSFTTPFGPNYDDYYSYGSEAYTASANYRPGNSNTSLRKPTRRVRPTTTSQKSKIGAPSDYSHPLRQQAPQTNSKNPSTQHSLRQKKSSIKKNTTSSQAPEDSSSFQISPVQSNKYPEDGEETSGLLQDEEIEVAKNENEVEAPPADKRSTPSQESEPEQEDEENEEEEEDEDEEEVARFSGESDLDRIIIQGSDEDRELESTQKNLEQEFDEVAEQYPQELQQLPRQRIVPKYVTQNVIERSYPRDPVKEAEQRHSALKKAYDRQISPPRRHRRSNTNNNPLTSKYPEVRQFDNNPALQRYAAGLMNSLQKKASRDFEDVRERNMISDLAKAREAERRGDHEEAAHWRTGAGRSTYSHGKRLSEEDRKKILDHIARTDYDSPNKKKPMNVQKEQYQDFTIQKGLVRPEDSNLNQSPEGKLRRERIYDHQNQGQNYSGYEKNDVGSYANAIDRSTQRRMSKNEGMSALKSGFNATERVAL